MSLRCEKNAVKPGSTHNSGFILLIYRITDVKIPLIPGTPPDRPESRACHATNAKHRFLRGMSAWVGFRQVGVTIKDSRVMPAKPSTPSKRCQASFECHHWFSCFPRNWQRISVLLPPVKRGRDPGGASAPDHRYSPVGAGFHIDRRTVLAN